MTKFLLFGNPLPFVSAALVGAACCLSVSPLAAAGPIDKRAIEQRNSAICSAWDVHITTLIEDFGRLNIVGSNDLAEAALQQIRARVLCASGRAQEAYEVYASIDFPMCLEEECADAIRRE